jgi:hypothetical protein
MGPCGRGGDPFHSSTSTAPGVDGGPDPDDEQDTQRNDEIGPRLGTLRRLAKALDVTVAELIAEGRPARDDPDWDGPGAVSLSRFTPPMSAFRRSVRGSRCERRVSQGHEGASYRQGTTASLSSQSSQAPPNTASPSCRE